MCTTDTKMAYLITSYRKNPSCTIFEAVCMTKEQAIQVHKRFLLEEGHKYVSVIHKIPFFNSDECKRHRPFDSTIPDGDPLCYVASEVVGGEVIPLFIDSSYHNASNKLEERDIEDFQIDLAHIVES